MCCILGALTFGEMYCLLKRAAQLIAILIFAISLSLELQLFRQRHMRYLVKESASLPKQTSSQLCMSQG